MKALISKSKDRSGLRGQAITEMTVAMVGIMAVFLGLLFMAALGVENIQTLLIAKGEADENAYDGVIEDAGQPILEWSYGNDELFFTADDSPNVGTGESAGYFEGQLTSTDGTLPLGGLDDSYALNNFADGFPNIYLFVSAAELTSHTETEADPLGARGLGGELEEGFRFLIHDPSDFIIRESVYMPRLP